MLSVIFLDRDGAWAPEAGKAPRGTVWTEQTDDAMRRDESLVPLRLSHANTRKWSEAPHLTILVHLIDDFGRASPTQHENIKATLRPSWRAASHWPSPIVRVRVRVCLFVLFVGH